MSLTLHFCATRAADRRLFGSVDASRHIAFAVAMRNVGITTASPYRHFAIRRARCAKFARNLTITTMSEIFEIKESGSLGRGLFATKLIKKGEQILEFTGPIISFEEALQKPMDKLSCPLQVGRTEYLDIQEPGVLVNHSCSPNAGVKNDCFLVAIQDILPEQEIYYDYSTTIEEDN